MNVQNSLFQHCCPQIYQNIPVQYNNNLKRPQIYQNFAVKLMRMDFPTMNIRPIAAGMNKNI
jgi:hypothetical protein